MKNQQWKEQQRVTESTNQEDHISKLPNTVLYNILSSVKVREAVKTSLLASRWRHVYANPTNLILDADNILKSDYSATNVLQTRMNRTPTFVASVNKYLSNVKNVQKIDQLKVCFTLRYGCTDLDGWIGFAIEKNVEEIDLCLMEETRLVSVPNYGSLYVFPCDIVGSKGASTSASASDFKSSLKCLRLAHCVLAPHKYYTSGFGTLTTLELLKVDLKSLVHIQILLSSCNNIEWLGFSECYNMDYLIIEHPFCQKLKYLNVNLCCQLKALMVHSTSLETLEYMGREIDFLFDAPRLKTFYSSVSASTACHREIWPVFRLPIDFPHLETLILECSCYMGEVMTNIFPTFPSLRHLEVIKVALHRQDLWWVARILKACPILERLDLHLRTYLCIEELRKPRWPSTCEHNHLKQVGITGIRGHTSEIDIAIYLLRNAIALEKMTIDPRPKSYIGKGKWDNSEACEDWSRQGREKVGKLLHQEASSAVNLVIK